MACNVGLNKLNLLLLATKYIRTVQTWSNNIKIKPSLICSTDVVTVIISTNAENNIYSILHILILVNSNFQDQIGPTVFSFLLPCLWSDLQLAYGSRVHWWCHWTGRLPAPQPAPGLRGDIAAVPGPGASEPGHNRAKIRCRCSAAGSCTADWTWTWLEIQTLSAVVRPVTTATCTKRGGRSSQEVEEDAKLQQTRGNQAVCQSRCYIHTV